MFSSEIKALLRFLGLLLVAEGGLVLLCLIPSLHFHDHTHWQIMASGLFTAAVGALLVVRYHRHTTIFDNRLAFLLIVVIWLVLALFGALPFLATGSVLNFTDAYFEAMSGFTSTGASVMAEVDRLPASVLLWRSMSQWFGGFGIILVVLALMPRMGINKYSLYTASASIEDPTSTQLSDNDMSFFRMVSVYLLLTGLFIWMFHSSGLQMWDAVNLTLTNISSGGFSIYDDGIASLTHQQQYLVALAMLFGGINFTMIYLFITFRWNKMEGKREQVVVYLLMFAVSVVFCLVALHYQSGYDWRDATRLAVVQSASAISTTGTQAVDASTWWTPIAFLFLLLAVCGGMAGSTSGGLKTMRAIILVRNVRTILRNQLHPHAVNPVRLNGRPVAHSVINNVMVLFFVSVVVAFLGIVLLMLCGEGGKDSIGAMMGCITGYGPRFGYSGALATYGGFATTSKWVCIAAMLMGRLECLTVIVLLYPPFWRKR